MNVFAFTHESLQIQNVMTYVDKYYSLYSIQSKFVSCRQFNEVTVKGLNK